MGLSASKNGRRTETFDNPNTGSMKTETVTIQVTPEVLERVEAQLLSSAKGTKSNIPNISGPGLLQNEGVRMNEDQYFQPTSSNPGQQEQHIVTSSNPVIDFKIRGQQEQHIVMDGDLMKELKKVQGIDEQSMPVPLYSSESIQKELKARTTEFEDFERQIDSAKNSLKDLNDALPNEKVVLGVGPDGRPTLETIGAWKIRQEKDEELRQNDIFWIDQLEALTGEYISSVTTGVDTFLERTEKLKETFPPPKENVCGPLCSKVADCYASNKNEVIRCRTVVDEFSRCVQRIGTPKLNEPLC